jgi:membrane protease YdiL (CAAX protease family)
LFKVSTGKNLMPILRSGYNRALIFSAIAFGLALGLVCLDESLLGLYMFTPLLATLVMVLSPSHKKSAIPTASMLGISCAGTRYWPIALIAPVLVLLNSYAIVWSLGTARLNAPPDPAAWLALVLDNSLALLPMMVFACGEEIGWRGYLLSCFAGLGARRSLLLVGFIHGLWHLPVMLLTSAYHADGNPFVIVPLFIITLTLGGVFYGYLRLRSGSIWPVVLAHATFNQAWQVLDDMTSSTSPLATEYLAGESGLLTLLGVAVIACLLLQRLSNPPGFTGNNNNTTAEIAAAGRNKTLRLIGLAETSKTSKTIVRKCRDNVQKRQCAASLDLLPFRSNLQCACSTSRNKVGQKLQQTSKHDAPQDGDF